MFVTRGPPRYLRTDNGPQFVSNHIKLSPGKMESNIDEQHLNGYRQNTKSQYPETPKNCSVKYMVVTEGQRWINS